MYPITIQDIVAATGGEYRGRPEKLTAAVTGVTHDSRAVTPGCLFVCIKGERADGHDFAPAAQQDGALCALAERPLPEGCDHVLVPSVVDAFQELAAFYRSRLDIPVVGIIGSVGKTTTKEMTAAVLGRRFTVLKTPENLNNQLGVPVTLLSIGQEHTAAVIEMGISDFHEMTRLAYMVRPDVVVFTNIGYCHLEKLGDLNGVLKAKTEVFQFVSPDAVAVVNGDDAMLRGYDFPVRCVTYGLGADCDLRAENAENCGFDGLKCDICHNFDSYPVHIAAFGEHMLYAALAAAAVGDVFKLTPAEIAAGIGDYRTIDGRANLIHTASLTVIDDCYNANPNSMSAALRSLAGVDGRRVAILGDMKELEPSAEPLHRAVGELAGELGIDLLITIGTLAEHLNAGFRSRCANPAYSFADQAALFEALPALLRKGDTVLVKASHSMDFGAIVEKLKTYDA